MTSRSFCHLARSRGVVIRALKVALVVGTLLALINHGDALISGALSWQRILQIILSYFVPYAVASYSAVQALQQDSS